MNIQTMKSMSMTIVCLDLEGVLIPEIWIAFAEKTGYSKFDSYTGNGNANGAFVYTGFKPAWIMLKKVGAGDGWFLLDGARNPTNTSTNGVLRADQSGAEGSASKLLDMVSNGFKLRGTESGFKYAEAFMIIKKIRD